MAISQPQASVAPRTSTSPKKVIKLLLSVSQISEKMQSEKEVLNGTPMGVSTRTYWHPQGVSIRTYWHPLEIIMELLNQLILNLSRVQGVLQGVLQGYYVMILLGVLQWVAI